MTALTFRLPCQVYYRQLFYEVQYKFQITIDITREKKNLLVAKNETTEISNLQKMQITNLKSQIVTSKYRDKEVYKVFNYEHLSQNLR